MYFIKNKHSVVSTRFKIQETDVKWILMGLHPSDNLVLRKARQQFAKPLTASIRSTPT